MFRSVEPYLEQAGIREPVVCYQGAAVVDPGTREFLLHEPLELDIAREAIARCSSMGSRRTSTSTTELYVAEETEYSRAYSGFQRLRVTEVGDLLAWLERPPTKLVAVAEPERLAEVRLDLERALRRSPLHHDLAPAPPGARATRRVEGLRARLRHAAPRDRPRARRRLRRRRERHRAARGGRLRDRRRGRSPPPRGDRGPDVSRPAGRGRRRRDRRPS